LACSRLPSVGVFPTR